MKLGLSQLSVRLVTTTMAQRKVPNFTFTHNPTKFADGKCLMERHGQSADALLDTHIHVGVTKTLTANPKLSILFKGPAASNESQDLERSRIDQVKQTEG